MHGKHYLHNILMQRDIRVGEWSPSFTENSFRFNAVYLHKIKKEQ